MRWILFPAIGYVDLHYLWNDVMLLVQLAGGDAGSQSSTAHGASSLSVVVVLAGLLVTLGLVAWQRARSRRPAHAPSQR